eukprot:TRINITY_DN2583_c0_g1_i3.p2 TRINITY_DN2583_c0_g1~~TRINITY_DN2583_c0_g1_i3.p2  ORF type:complete len:566 (+),score=170.16 TRINITY_DN2583_c0_g1_i3:123-1820(+)
MNKAVLAVFALACLCTAASACKKLSAQQVVETITKYSRVVDLTNTFSDTTPLWHGFPASTTKLMYYYDDTDPAHHPSDGTGFYVNRYCHPGQDGTHMDPPAHFIQGLRTIDQIELDEMLLPLVVLDVHEKVAENNDYEITMEDVIEYEQQYGVIPEHAFVALYTGWSSRWSQGLDAMDNLDANGVGHTPGWSMEVLQYLYETRGITASGHEMLDTDAGYVTTTTGQWPLETYILNTDHYQIEAMTNLGAADASGCLVFVGVPKIEGGSGFPARVYAICPLQQGNRRFAQAAEQLLAGDKFELSHEVNEDVPHWKGFDNTATRDTLYWYQNDGTVNATLDYGFYASEYCHVSQWSTHCDPPAHFHKGKRFLDEIPVSQMVMPLVVLDVHEKVEQNSDYVITLDDVHEWEEEHNTRVPQGSFVAMRTDWANRWPSDAEIANKDENGVFHYPGWSQDVLSYLYEERLITASGHETTDTDPGLRTTVDDYSLESYILSLNHYQIELLANLGDPLDYGCVALTSWPKRAEGSGFSARVIAVCPQEEDPGHNHHGHHHHRHHDHTHTHYDQ